MAFPICENDKELCEAVPYALKFSQNQRVIVERYMAAYPDVCMYFNLQNGVLSLSSMCERDMNQVQEGEGHAAQCIIILPLPVYSALL